MEIIKINKNKNYSNLYSSKINVAAYIRVSTKFDIQQNSLESQRLYFTDKINKYYHWNFVGIYEDNGISGRSTKLRKGFQKMITDAKNGKIDLILTKSISRFSRNVSDAIEIIRDLKERNIGIYFEEEHIYTLDMKGEMLLTVLLAIAEQETNNFSLNVQLGKEMLASRGIATNGKRCYGFDYDKETKTFSINKKEAEIIKEIFDMYAYQGKNTNQISNYLTKNKYKSYYENAKWDSTRVHQILTNERYIGNIILLSNNKRTYIQIQKKPIYRIIGFSERIIDDETFNIVQEKIKHSKMEKDIHKNDNRIFKSKIKCGRCGSAYRYDSIRENNGINTTSLVCRSCHKNRYQEENLKNFLIECINKLINKNLYDKTNQILKKNTSDIKKLKKEQQILENEKLISYNNFILTKNIKIYKENIEHINNEIEFINLKIKNINEQSSNIKKYFDSIKEIYDNLNKSNILEENFKNIVTFVFIGEVSEKDNFDCNVIRFIFIKDFKESPNRKEALNNYKKILKLEENKRYILLNYISKYQRTTRFGNYKVRIKFEIIDNEE